MERRFPLGHHAEVIGESTESTPQKTRSLLVGIAAGSRDLALAASSRSAASVGLLTFVLLPMALVGGATAPYDSNGRSLFQKGPTIWTVATSFSLTLRPEGVSSCMFSTSVTLFRADGIAVDMDVVRPAECEDVTDLFAGYEGRCLPPDLSRSQPDRSSFGQIGFNLDMRQVSLQRCMGHQ